MSPPRLYASLIGPLTDLYLPLPFNDVHICKRALETSSLHSLWLHIHTEAEVDDLCREFPHFVKLPDRSKSLDYDYRDVEDYVLDRGLTMDDVIHNYTEAL